MDTSDNSGVSPSLITLFFSQQHQQQQQQSKDGASASTQKQLQKQYIQQFLESQESPLDNINSVDFKKYMYQLMIKYVLCTLGVNVILVSYAVMVSLVPHQPSQTLPCYVC